MKTLRYFLRPKQKTLFKRLCEIFGDEIVAVDEDNFILVREKVPVLLVTHLDTVHKHAVREIVEEDDGNILFSRQSTKKRGSCSPATKNVTASARKNSVTCTLKKNCPSNFPR